MNTRSQSVLAFLIFVAVLALTSEARPDTIGWVIGTASLLSLAGALYYADALHERDDR